jgi:FAD/FMN-containing dehydrogenase
MATLATIARRLDPGGLMNPGVLLPTDAAAAADR